MPFKNFMYLSRLKLKDITAVSLFSNSRWMQTYNTSAFLLAILQKGLMLKCLLEPRLGVPAFQESIGAATVNEITSCTKCSSIIHLPRCAGDTHPLQLKFQPSDMSVETNINV